MLTSTGGRLARVQYLSGSFRVTAPGDHVICAVTGRKLPLNTLRYWSAELQEAYTDVEAAATRYAGAKAAGQI